MADAPCIEDLLAEARHHRHRYDLYRANVSDLRPTTLAHLRELERAAQRAGARLRQAQHEGAPHTRD
jgi:hypothetical protein